MPTLFEAVGALMKFFEAARAVVEGRIRPPYGVEAAGLHIDIAHGVVAEYVIRSEEGEIPARIVYSPDVERAYGAEAYGQPPAQLVRVHEAE